jgi:hypothetical protein
MSTIRANTIVNMDGVTAVTLTGQRAAKVWINFVGSSATTRASFNISSVTKNGTGDYTITVTNTLLDSSYSFSHGDQYSGSGSSTKQNIWTNVPDGSNNITASSLRLTPIGYTATSYDCDTVVATIHR